MVEVNEEEDKLDVEIAFRIKMRKWSRDRNGDLNGDERGIVYYLQKDWVKDLCTVVPHDTRNINYG